MENPVEHTYQPILSNTAGRPLTKTFELPLPLPDRQRKRTPVSIAHDAKG